MTAALLALLLAGETTATLSLRDLFAEKPAATPAPAWVANTVLEAPSLAEWRAAIPAAPTPTMAIDESEMPNIVRRPPGAFPTEDEDAGEFLLRGAAHSNAAAKDLAIVTIRSEWTRLRQRIELAREDAPTSTIVLLHGPGVSETFALEPGVWRVRRTVWLPDAPDVRVGLVSGGQQLLGGFLHSGLCAEREEESWIRRLEGELGRRRREAARRREAP
jgi:hypothetical protein